MRTSQKETMQAISELFGIPIELVDPPLGSFARLEVERQRFIREHITPLVDEMDGKISIEVSGVVVSEEKMDGRIPLPCDIRGRALYLERKALPRDPTGAPL